MRLYLSLISIASILAMPAFAHVTANPNAGESGQYFETKFRISHGCDGSDTVEVHLTLPKGTVIAKPQAKSGWKIDVVKSKLDAPVSIGHGKTTDEQFDKIIWKGGRLADSQYDEFGLITKLPNVVQEETIWFPVKQVCKKGEADWKNIPENGTSWGDTDHPAPFVKVTPAKAPKHHH
jgi:uncharacterized protein YcnI